MVIQNLINDISLLPDEIITSRVIEVSAHFVTVYLCGPYMRLGTRIIIVNDQKKECLCEIIRLETSKAIAMAFDDLNGISQDNIVYILQDEATLYPDDSWLGRVIDPLGKPIDNSQMLSKGSVPYSLKAPAPKAILREKIDTQIITGIKTIDVFIPISEGQRIGVFAQAGTGKSSLLRMLTFSIKCDIVIVALVGERGRELNDFIDIALKDNKKQRTTIVMASSDTSALMRSEAVATAMTLAEYHRDKGRSVLLIVDSLTRYAHALRDIAITSGEPPSARGYCPSIFSTLPKMLERAGKANTGGSITGIFSLLLEDDKTSDPLAEIIKAVLDGHLALSRDMAQSGIYPAIDIRQSISRIPIQEDDEQKYIINTSRHYLSIYEDMHDMIRMGAYTSGTNKETDESIEFYHQLKKFICQNMYDISELENSRQELAQILQNIIHKSA